jgi:hypothetical protein
VYSWFRRRLDLGLLDAPLREVVELILEDNPELRNASRFMVVRWIVTLDRLFPVVFNADTRASPN